MQILHKYSYLEKVRDGAPHVMDGIAHYRKRALFGPLRGRKATGVIETDINTSDNVFKVTWHAMFLPDRTRARVSAQR